MPGYAEQGARALLVGPGTTMYNNLPMEVSKPLGRPRTLPIVVEQIVPSRVCFTCDVCCRFPERDSPLRSRPGWARSARRDRKSTRLNSSHGYISYAVFCFKKKILRDGLV